VGGEAPHLLEASPGQPRGARPGGPNHPRTNPGWFYSPQEPPRHFKMTESQSNHKNQIPWLGVEFELIRRPLQAERRVRFGVSPLLPWTILTSISAKRRITDGNHRILRGDLRSACCALTLWSTAVRVCDRLALGSCALLVLSGGWATSTVGIFENLLSWGPRLKSNRFWGLGGEVSLGGRDLLGCRIGGHYTRPPVGISPLPVSRRPQFTAHQSPLGPDPSPGPPLSRPPRGDLPFPVPWLKFSSRIQVEFGGY
jgi:hypothetical protein